MLDSRILIEPQLIPALLDHWNTEHSERFRIMVTEEEEKRAEEANELADSIQLTARLPLRISKLSAIRCWLALF